MTQLFFKNLEGSTSMINAMDMESLLPVLSAGKYIETTEELLGLTNLSTVYEVNEGLIGGGKKKKKRTYTTPKKNKHKHKKVKLAVLKFYKVDKTGVSRLRKECPNTTCGAGVFLAKHQNRFYCGRCNMSYQISA